MTPFADRLLDDARNVSDGPEDPFLDDTEVGDADELDWDDPRPDVGQDATPTATTRLLRGPSATHGGLSRDPG